MTEAQIVQRVEQMMAALYRDNPPYDEFMRVMRQIERFADLQRHRNAFLRCWGE